MEMKRRLFAFWLGLRSPDSCGTAGLTCMTLGINYTNSVIVWFYASIAMSTKLNSFLPTLTPRALSAELLKHWQLRVTHSYRWLFFLKCLCLN